MALALTADPGSNPSPNASPNPDSSPDPSPSQVWGRRCAFSDAPLGGQQTLVLTRWERARPAALDNLLMLTKACAEQHDAAAAPRAAAVAAHSSHFVLAVERSLRRAAAEGAVWRNVGTAA